MQAALVEVKTSLTETCFELSGAQWALARRLGQRFWLATVRLADGVGQLQVHQELLWRVARQSLSI